MIYNCLDYKTYICNIDDFADIIKISDSQPKIHGEEKSDMYRNVFKSYVNSILNLEKENIKILGSRNIKTGELVSYLIILTPPDSCFGFWLFNERIKRNTLLSEDPSSWGLFRLASMIFESEKRFDYFYVVESSKFLAVISAVKKFCILDNGNPLRYHLSINSVVMPEETPSTVIQRALLKIDALVPRKVPVTIIHASLKAEYRLDYFKDIFNNSEKIIKKIAS